MGGLSMVAKWWYVAFSSSGQVLFRVFMEQSCDLPYLMRGREGGRERGRETERETHRERDTQRERETDRQTERQLGFG
jgi:hypothetical protein